MHPMHTMGAKLVSDGGSNMIHLDELIKEVRCRRFKPV